VPVVGAQRRMRLVTQRRGNLAARRYFFQSCDWGFNRGVDIRNPSVLVFREIENKVAILMVLRLQTDLKTVLAPCGLSKLQTSLQHLPRSFIQDYLGVVLHFDFSYTPSFLICLS
jgi:hypothetical protein